MQRRPVKAGLSLKCGRCGQGPLFQRYLKFHDSCEACGLDFSTADTADGPAFFVGSIIMIVFAPFYFLLPVIELPLMVSLSLWALVLGAMAGATLVLLPRFKAILFNLQAQNSAEEAKFTSTGKHGQPPKGWKH